MVEMWPTFYLPVGTTIDTGDEYGVVTKTGERCHPFPWTTAHGTQYGNEWAQWQIDAGATATEPKGR